MKIIKLVKTKTLYLDMNLYGLVLGGIFLFFAIRNQDYLLGFLGLLITFIRYKADNTKTITYKKSIDL